MGGSKSNSTVFDSLEVKGAFQEQEESKTTEKQSREEYTEENQDYQESPETRFIPSSGGMAQRRLVEKAIKGNQKAISKVIEMYYQDILYFTTKKVGLQEGEDVAQQAIVRIVNNLSGLKDPAKIKPWMITVAYNVCIKHIKDKVRTRSLITGTEILEEKQESVKENDDELLPENAFLDVEKRKQVLRVIDTLPENYADCIRMYYYDGFSYQEIAEVLGVTWAKVRNDLFRGRTLFKKNYEKETEVVYRFSAASAAAFAVLSRVFEAEQASLVTTEASARLLAFAGKEIALLPRSPFSSFFGSLGGKVASGVFALTAVAGGVSIYALQEEPQKTNPEVPLVAEKEADTEQALPQKETVQEKAIDTLSDMIGETEASRLEAFVEGSVNASEWASFLSYIGAAEEDVAIEYDYRYTMYSLCKQDKQLLIFERVDVSSGQIRVLYQFGADKELPLMMEVVLLFS